MMWLVTALGWAQIVLEACVVIGGGAGLILLVLGLALRRGRFVWLGLLLIAGAVVLWVGVASFA